MAETSLLASRNSICVSVRLEYTEPATVHFAWQSKYKERAYWIASSRCAGARNVSIVLPHTPVVEQKK